MKTIFKRQGTSTGRSGRGRAKRSLVIFSGILIFSLAVASVAYAFTVGNIDGVWGTIDSDGATCDRWATGPGGAPTNTSDSNPSIQTPPNTDENQVRYGTSGFSCNNTNFANQSGFGFDGSNGPVSPAMDTPFYLGKFTHYNWPISANNSFEYVDLSVTVPVTCDISGSTNFTFNTHYTLDETSNTPPCAYPGSTNCPDKVEITQPALSNFTCDGANYTVNLLGFTTTGLNGQNCDQSYNPGAVATIYYTEESSTNVACLWATITQPNVNVAAAKTCANFNSVDPFYRMVITNSGPGSARDVEFTDTFSALLDIDPLVYTSQLVTTLGGTVNQGLCTRSGQTVTCDLLTPLPATSYDPLAKWIVEIRPNSWPATPTSISNTMVATTTSNDTALANNTSTCTSETPTAVSVAGPSARILGAAVQVEWQSASELNISGFELYRAGADGVRTLIFTTPAIDPGKLSGNDYGFTDSTVEVGIAYTYTVDVILTDGTTETLAPARVTLPGGMLMLYLPSLIR